MRARSTCFLGVLVAALLGVHPAAAQPADEPPGAPAPTGEAETAEAQTPTDNPPAADETSDTPKTTDDPLAAEAPPDLAAPPTDAPLPPPLHSGTDPHSVATSAGRSELPLTGRRSLESRMQRAHGMAEVGLGWLTLPGAEVCVERGDDPNCRRGDSSLALEAWQIFRMPNAFAVGGGVMLGLTPTTDAPAQSARDVQRDHTRGYLTVEGVVRYYPYVGESLEGWMGLAAGLVVINDTFSTVEASAEQKPLLGPAGIVIRTEGGTFGMAGGLAYEFARNWTFGGNVRMGSWFLPQQPAESPFGDEASLIGQISWFVITANVAFRVQL